MHGLTIGESARRAAVPVYTIRYYERQGLIARRAKSLVGCTLCTRGGD